MVVYISLIVPTNVVFWIPLLLPSTSEVLVTVTCVCSVHSGPFGCWPLHLVIQSGVPCTLSRLVPALFWLPHDLMLRHLYVSDHHNRTIINLRVLRAPPHLVFDALSDPLGKLIPLFSLAPCLWHSQWSSAVILCFSETFPPQPILLLLNFWCIKGGKK